MFKKRNAGRIPLAALGALLLLFLVSPLVYFLFQLPWPDVPGQLTDPLAVSSLATSLLTATIATILMALLGVPLGYLLARGRFPGRGALTLLIYLPLVFPPVVSGILLLLLYGPYGPIGAPFANVNLELDTSFIGIVLAQVFVASPFVVIVSRAAFEAVNPALEEVAATLGKGAFAIFWHVNLPVARAGIIAGLLLGWLRALGEFGATVVLAYHPYTLPVYTYVQLSGTGVDAALPIALLSLGVSSIGVSLVFWVERSARLRRAQ